MKNDIAIKTVEELKTEIDRRITAADHLLQISRGILGDSRREEFETVSEWITECRNSYASPEPVSIALLGGTGAGKSTLVNALIGASILPTSSISVCTSSITRVRYKAGSEFSASIEIVPRDTWLNQVQLASDDVKASKNVDPDEASYTTVSVIPEDEAARIRAIYGDDQYSKFLIDGDISVLVEPDEITTAFDDKTIVLTHDNTDDLRKDVARFLTSKEKFWPIVRSCTIEGPFESFDHGGELVDLPGLNDPNEAREELTKKYLETAKFVWVVFNMKRALGKDLTQVLKSRDLLNRLMAGGRISTLTFVGTHSDDVSTSNPDDFGLEEDASNSEIALSRNVAAEDELRNNLRSIARSIATTSDETPESQAIIDTLVSSRAFMVSASNYLQMRGTTKSRVQVIFDDVHETNLPQLSNHLRELCVEAGPKANAFTLVSSIEEIVAELSAIANQEKAEAMLRNQVGEKAQAEIAQTVQAAEVELKKKSEKILAKLRRSLQAAVGRFEEGTAIDKQVVGRLVRRTTGDWAKIHWSTMRATTSRGGRYTSSTAGELDFVKELSAPVIINSIPPWTEFFERELPSLTADANGALKIALDSYIARLQEKSSKNEEATKLLGELLPDLVADVNEAVEAALAVAQKTVESDLSKRQQELHRITEDAIMAGMESVFAGAAAERGTGMKIRMNQILESGSSRAVNSACDLVQKKLAEIAAEAVESVLSEIEPVADRIGEKCDAITQSLGKAEPTKKVVSAKELSDLLHAVNAARQIVQPKIAFENGKLSREPIAIPVPVPDSGEAPDKQLKKRPLFIDASNVARTPGAGPDIELLEAARISAMEKFPDCSIVLIADASLSRLTQNESPAEDYELFKKMVSDHRLSNVPPGTKGKADKYILDLATSNNGIVISNDSFKEFQVDYPWLFEEGRLFGHSYIEGIGWLFSQRFPVKLR